MDNETKPKSLPEKVVRRHADMLGELLPEITRLVIEEGRPADGLLSRHLRAHKELGSRDRRFLSQAVFSYFRWYGWTVNKLKLSATDASLIGAALDSADLGESFQYLENHSRLPFPVKPLGDKSLPEKAAMLNKMLNGTEGFQPLELSDLVLPDFADIIDPEKALPCIEQFQKRPPTWIRSRTSTLGASSYTTSEARGARSTSRAGPTTYRWVWTSASAGTRSLSSIRAFRRSTRPPHPGATSS